MNIAFQYLTYSWIHTFLFILFFMVLLRGFLGFYQDWVNKAKSGIWHFAWFKLGKVKQKGKSNDEESVQD